MYFERGTRCIEAQLSPRLHSRLNWKYSSAIVHCCCKMLLLMPDYSPRVRRRSPNDQVRAPISRVCGKVLLFYFHRVALMNVRFRAMIRWTIPSLIDVVDSFVIKGILRRCSLWTCILFSPIPLVSQVFMAISDRIRFVPVLSYITRTVSS